jgi:glycosyltransferase involved in cell wall biosynthesis
MRIAFNATSLLSSLTGTGLYTKFLLEKLIQNPEFSFTMFYAKAWSSDLLDPKMSTPPYIKNLVRKYIPYAYSMNRFIQQYHFDAGIKKSQFDLYHEPNFLAFDFYGPIVLTVHDLSWIRYPETHPKERVAAMNRLFESSLLRADKVITDSAFVRQELVSVFGVSDEKISPVYLGVSSDFFPRESNETFATLISFNLIHGSYFIAVGTIEPRKNLQVALNAFMRLPKKMRQQYPLVIVGMMGWHTDAFERLVGPLISSGEVKLLGYLSQVDLIHVIAGALSLIYPSVYEGFGLPPLEAMACGVPVITSNVSSIPEVVGNAGMLLDPFDVDGFSNAMRKMVESKADRDHLAKIALERSLHFNWDKTAVGTIEVYHQALAST